MLETPCIQRYSLTVAPCCQGGNVSSDKPSGADNQQERPLAAEWVVGFVDGEGCFGVPIFRNRTCRSGWQCQPEFAVVHGGEEHLSPIWSADVFRMRFGDRESPRRESSAGDGTLRRRRLSDLSERVIPFFVANPLFTAKASDFACFSRVVSLMREGVHLRMDGLELIAGISETMNNRKPSRLAESSEAIRRPSDLDGSDEDMVLASRRRGGN
jgi:hypothetical protein